MKAGSELTVKRMVKLAQVSRASFYRFDADAAVGPDPDMDLRDAIQRIALEWPSYGRRRITAALRRQRWTVNPKRVYRLMGEDNLLCVRKRKFVVTTDSNHGRKVYPNLAGTMVLTGMERNLLTAREHQILLLICRLKSSKLVAFELGVSVHTIATHRKQLCQKLHVHSAIEMFAAGTMFLAVEGCAA